MAVRVAVVSDTHGDIQNLAGVKEQLGRVDWLLHAGDFIRDAGPVAQQLGVPEDRVRAVIGNCDYLLSEPLHDVIRLEGVRIFLTHGHLYGVKHTLDRIYHKAVEVRARVAIFGHSHVAISAEDSGLLLLNPGSLSQPRLVKAGPSCALLEIDGTQVRSRILSVSG